MKNKKQIIKRYIKLHLCILFFTMSTVMSKVAAKFEFLSFKYIICFIIMFAILGIYAIVWQQAIKGFSPSVAYSNKSVTTIWVLLFSNILFQEGIEIQNVIGAALIIMGVVMVARNE